MLFDYDDTSIESILNYAKKLKNKTFREILNEYENSPVKKYVQRKLLIITQIPNQRDN